jgi:hypothetical protein
MFVITRSGTQEPCRFDKITDRITSLAYGLNPDYCDPVRRGAARARAAGAARVFRAGCGLACLLLFGFLCVDDGRPAFRRLSWRRR